MLRNIILLTYVKPEFRTRNMRNVSLGQDTAIEAAWIKISCHTGVGGILITHEHLGVITDPSDEVPDFILILDVICAKNINCPNEVLRLCGPVSRRLANIKLRILVELRLGPVLSASKTITEDNCRMDVVDIGIGMPPDVKKLRSLARPTITSRAYGNQIEDGQCKKRILGVREIMIESRIGW